MSSAPELRDRLGYLLKHAFMQLDDLVTAVLAPHGINGRELGLLIHIGSHEPASQQQIAQRMQIDRTTMVALLDTLEAKNLVARRPHTEDRRRNIVALTDHGHEILKLGKEASAEAERRFLAPLDAEAARQLRAALQEIVE
ncbi:MarR family winged helix-turn-helix transcriptional regulator [Kibdelosporangium lantanae]|uniref:MarR family winged helix-turn-helix transcriptional regulator n=1 Tax=Kibdelosporangium lantanae TaxID=1497396 RepID=A0ABW3M868_9PSEU